MKQCKRYIAMAAATLVLATCLPFYLFVRRMSYTSDAIDKSVLIDPASIDYDENAYNSALTILDGQTLGYETTETITIGHSYIQHYRTYSEWPAELKAAWAGLARRYFLGVVSHGDYKFETTRFWALEFERRLMYQYAPYYEEDDYYPIHYTASTASTADMDGDYTVTVSVSLGYLMYAHNQSEVYRKSIDVICRSILTDGDDRVKAVEIISAWVAENTSYYLPNGDLYITSVSGQDVLDSHKGCCCGYSMITQWLCDYCNIPTLVETGQNENGDAHAWNTFFFGWDLFAFDVTGNDGSHINAYLSGIQNRESPKKVSTLLHEDANFTVSHRYQWFNYRLRHDKRYITGRNDDLLVLLQAFTYQYGEVIIKDNCVSVSYTTPMSKQFYLLA